MFPLSAGSSADMLLDRGGQHRHTANMRLRIITSNVMPQARDLLLLSGTMLRRYLYIDFPYLRLFDSIMMTESGRTPWHS